MAGELDWLSDSVSVGGGYAGDEGKGKIITYLVDTIKPDYVVRYQGGSNAGHTLVVGDKEVKANLLPSGVLHSFTTNVIGTGVALNLEKLQSELEKLVSVGVPHPKLKISKRAQLVLPYHITLDVGQEQQRGDNQLGTTKQGIGPFYESVMARAGIQVGALQHPKTLRQQVDSAVAYANSRLFTIGARPLSTSSVLQYLEQYTDWAPEFVCDTEELLRTAQKRGESIVLEAQLGPIRDVLYGQIPHVTSSHPSLRYAGTVTGIEARDRIMVLKAYSSMVGTGKLATAIEDPDLAAKLRAKGGNRGEFGAVTGRPRDLGWLDLPAAKFAAEYHGATSVALTCLDVWGELELSEIKVCVDYELHGRLLGRYPDPWELEDATPVYECLPAWQTPRSEMATVTSGYDLPDEAANFIEFVEESLDYSVDIVSVGPAAHQTIDVRFWV